MNAVFSFRRPDRPSFTFIKRLLSWYWTSKEHFRLVLYCYCTAVQPISKCIVWIYLFRTAIIDTEEICLNWMKNKVSQTIVCCVLTLIFTVEYAAIETRGTAFITSIRWRPADISLLKAGYVTQHWQPVDSNEDITAQIMAEEIESYKTVYQTFCRIGGNKTKSRPISQRQNYMGKAR